MSKQLRVTEKAVLEAMESCPEAKRVLEKLFGDQITPKPTYAYGMRFRTKEGGGDEYIIAQIDTDLVCLICLTDGNRWTDPLKVGDSLNLTEEEFTILAGRTKRFIRI